MRFNMKTASSRLVFDVSSFDSIEFSRSKNFMCYRLPVSLIAWTIRGTYRVAIDASSVIRPS